MLDYSGVVIDATNPLSTWPGLEINIDHSKTSASEDLQSVSLNSWSFYSMAMGQISVTIAVELPCTTIFFSFLNFQLFVTILKAIYMYIMI